MNQRKGVQPRGVLSIRHWVSSRKALYRLAHSSKSARAMGEMNIAACESNRLPHPRFATKCPIPPRRLARSCNFM